jgi:SAM-dependent methyltransferase
MTAPVDRSPTVPADEDVGAFAFQVATQMTGAVTAAMIHLGDRLGLFRALAAADGPIDAATLAERTGLVERWVREWAYNQAAAGLVVAHTSDGAELFALAPEAVPVLVDESHEMNLLGMFHQLPHHMAQLTDALPESFRTGIGHDYDTFGPEGAIGVERGFGPWMANHLVADVLPLMDGVVGRLRSGASGADVGCGTGAAVRILARAFPASRFAGYDISRHALERARRQAADAGLAKVEFHDPRSDPLPDDGSLAFVTTFDCLHDMTDPSAAARVIRDALADDGVWLVADIKAYDTFAENVERNPMAALMYGTSVLSCMSSALSEPGGEGLGTLGLSERRAAAMADAAGFGRFRRLDVDHRINAFYEIRP